MFSKRIDWAVNADAVKGQSVFSETSGFNSVTAGLDPELCH